MDLEFCERLYWKEIDRKRHLDNSIRYPGTAITLLISAGIFCWGQKYSNGFYLIDNLEIIVLVGFLLLFVAILFSLFFLMRFFFGLSRAYQYIPGPKSLQDHKLVLYSHYMNASSVIHYKDKFVKDEVAIRFEEDLKGQFISCTEFNMEINDIRSNAFYWGRLCMYIAIILLLLVGSLTIL